MARPKMEIERQQTGFRLRADLVKTFRHLAIDTGKPVNVVIEEALEEYLRTRGLDVPQAGDDPDGS